MLTNRTMAGFCLLLASVIVPLSGAAVARSQEEWSARVEQALASAYAAVREAEDSGADISSALTELNDAASALARAESLYRQGEMVEAAEAASRAFTTASRVTESAYGLKELAVAKQADLLRLALGEWALSLCATVILGRLSWGWFAKWYHSRLLDMVVVEAGRDEP